MSEVRGRRPEVRIWRGERGEMRRERPQERDEF
jgi:hypothetical protein